MIITIIATEKNTQKNHLKSRRMEDLCGWRVSIYFLCFLCRVLCVTSHSIAYYWNGYPSRISRSLIDSLLDSGRRY